MYPPEVAMPSPVAAATEGSTRAASSGHQPEFDEVIEDILNHTDELSELHHVDAPSDSVYMICGVLIAMLLVAVIIILLAVTISKLRKREEASAAAGSDVVAMQTLPPPASNASTFPGGLPPQQQGAATTVLWSYPIFGVDRHDSLAMPLPMVQPDPTTASTTSTSHNGFCRGFRRNLRGRWRRLVKRKPTTEIYTIPAELRPQLKHMYVY